MSTGFQVLEKLLRALDKELFVILERSSVEALIPGASLLGINRHVAYRNDGESSMATARVNLARIQSMPRREIRSKEYGQGPLGMV